MINSFSDLVSKSGDSILKNYVFEKGVLKVDLIMYDFDDMEVEIPTTTVYSLVSKEQYSPTDCRRTVRIVTYVLQDRLKVENGFFIPQQDFKELMADARNFHTLAYGRRTTEVIGQINFVGSVLWLACLVEDFQKVTWQMK